ncbi:glycine dehydrogenase (aminomethyl-transferring), partial [Mesorhizobium sp. M7A.F.Ca.US.001.01.1.1]
LKPYLPGHVTEGSAHAVSAAPFGSASILPITWMYIRMMGASGLKQATETAILSANYIATRLGAHFPVLYKGRQGRVAHECILDTRVLKESAGISVDDVAKRLIDYGFHAPTMSFPVAGTLMVEPTESEPKREIDRFCEAMIAISAEAAKVARGEWPLADNPLVNAPHTAAEALAGQWNHPYSRLEAAYPAGDADTAAKYWPPVSRID